MRSSVKAGEGGGEGGAGACVEHTAEQLACSVEVINHG